jgi:hypothetical protein
MSKIWPYAIIGIIILFLIHQEVFCFDNKQYKPRLSLIDGNTLLQSNATIIAGPLILLTLIFQTTNLITILNDLDKEASVFS